MQILFLCLVALENNLFSIAGSGTIYLPLLMSQAMSLSRLGYKLSTGDDILLHLLIFCSLIIYITRLGTCLYIYVTFSVCLSVY